MSGKKTLELEYTINTSPKILYPRLGTATGLSEWFADDVMINSKIFTFIWDGSEQKAELISSKKEDHVKFRWLDDEDAFFEFKINKQALTGDVALLIYDVIDEDDEDDTVDLWDKQISQLKRVLGL